MRSPADMTIIQIELTNACPNRCSNCTRLCGHQKKPFMLSWEDFQQAVKSLEGFQGMAGLMGGEPTLHPQFDAFSRYLAENFGVHETLKRGREPITDFSRYISNELLSIKKRGRCLCSSLGKKYAEHFEVIQETFHYQLLNDHRHSGMHQGILISRKDLGIPDEEWFPLRDACWIQNNWSASITPKGAFFCEVAGTLDLLFNGPGGWPVEPGWWKRTPEEFGDQLQWCELCGIALKGPLTSARDGLDDVSPTLLAKLQEIESPKVKAGKYKLYNPRNIEVSGSEYTPGKPFYLPGGDKMERIRPTNEDLFPDTFSGLFIAAEPDQVTAEQTDELTKHLGFECMVSGYASVGESLELLIDREKTANWILLLNEKTRLSPDWLTRIKKTVFNPGCLYVCGLPTVLGGCGEALAVAAEPLFAMVNPLAAQFGKIKWDDIHTLNDLIENWESEKVIPLKGDYDRPVPVSANNGVPNKAAIKKELMREHVLTCWKMITGSYANVALYGAGQHTAWMLRLLGETELPLPCVIYDDAPSCQELAGIPVLKSGVSSHQVDAVVVSSDAHAASMAERAGAIWQEGVPIVNLYSAFNNPVFEK